MCDSPVDYNEIRRLQRIKQEQDERAHRELKRVAKAKRARAAKRRAAALKAKRAAAAKKAAATRRPKAKAKTLTVFLKPEPIVTQVSVIPRRKAATAPKARTTRTN